MASCTIASETCPWAVSDSAPLKAVSPFAMSAGLAPASSARRIAATAVACSDLTRLSSRCFARAAESGAAAAVLDGALDEFIQRYLTWQLGRDGQAA